MSADKYPSIFSKSNRGCRIYYPSNIFRSARSFDKWRIFNNYSPKWRWLGVDIYRAANEIIYTKKINLMISSLVKDANRDDIFPELLGGK